MRFNKGKPQNYEHRDPSTVCPVGTMVLMCRDFSENMTKGGLIIPDSIRKPAKRGVVLAIGNKLCDDCRELKVGDTVYLHGSALIPHRFQWDGKYYDMVNSEDIEAIMPSVPEGETANV